MRCSTVEYNKKRVHLLYLNPEYHSINIFIADFSLIQFIRNAVCGVMFTFFQQNINWCTRKHGEKYWTNVVLQDATFSRTQATSNSSGRVKIFSEITYHVTSLDTEIHFMFEISTHYKCGTGLESSNVSLHIVSGKFNIT